MPTARLVLAVDGGGDVTRAMGAIRTGARRANEAMNADARQAKQSRVKLEMEEVREVERMLRQKHMQKARAERAAVAAAKAASRERVQISREEEIHGIKKERELSKLEHQRTQNAIAETRARIRVATDEARAQVQIARNAQQQINQLERGGPYRGGQPREPGTPGGQRPGRPGRGGIGRSIGRTIVTGGQMVNTAVSGAMAQIQTAEERRASAEYTLNSALIQTTNNPQEIARRRRQVFEYAEQHGLHADELASALAEGQSRHSGLAGNTEAERDAAMQSSLEAAQFARNAHTEIAPTVRFGAMLRQQGVSAGMQRELLRNFTAISYGGSIEVGEGLQQGLPSMLQAMNAALANRPGANRDQVIRETLTNFFAQAQLLGGGGMNTAPAGQRLMTMQTMLSSDRTQNRLGERLYERFANDPQRRQTLDRMFTRDRQGNYHLRNELRDPAEFSARIDSLFGGDPAAVRNFMRNAGHRGGQLLNRPEAAALVGMLNTVVDPNTGQTVKAYERVRTLRNESLSASQLQAAEAVTAGEIDTKVARREERETNRLLSSNTDAVRDLNTTLQDFRSNHPLLAGIVNKLGGETAEIGLGKFAGAAGIDRPYSDAVQAEAHRIYMGKTGGFMESVLNADKRTKGARGQLTSREIASLQGGELQSQDFFMEQLTTGATHDVRNRDRYSKGASGTLTAAELLAAVRQGIREGMQGATVEIPPAAAVHAATVVSTQPTTAPGPRR